jgi:uncharacterized Zn-finger protein
MDGGDKVIMWAVILSAVFFAGFMLFGVAQKRNIAHAEITAVAEDLGCTFIEQSYYHPENFYIDCGDGNIQILTVGAK